MEVYMGWIPMKNLERKQDFNEAVKGRIGKCWRGKKRSSRQEEPPKSDLGLSLEGKEI